MIDEIRHEVQSRMVRGDIAKQVVEFAGTLNERDQTVMLFVLRGKNQVSTANIMGVPQQTVSWVISNRLKKLAEILVKSGAQASYSNRGGGV